MQDTIVMIYKPASLLKMAAIASLQIRSDQSAASQHVDSLSIKASRRQDIGDKMCSDWLGTGQNIWIGSGPNVIVWPDAQGDL